MSNREAVFPAGRHALYERHGYSAAIRSGDLLFVSGQVGSRTDGSPEPDFAAQVQLAFENLRQTLAAAGCSFDDLIDVTTFHTDPETQFATIMEVKKRYFRSHLILTGRRSALTGWQDSILKSKSLPVSPDSAPGKKPSSGWDDGFFKRSGALLNNR